MTSPRRSADSDNGDDADAPTEGRSPTCCRSSSWTGRWCATRSSTTELAPLFDEVEGFGGDQLSKTFGTDSVVGVYATPDEQVRVAVTIYDGESGLFIQTGPPVPPEMSANSETAGEYVHQGDSVCFAQWQSQAKAQGGPPFQVQCQLVVGGRTINVYEAGGLDVEQTADLADDIARQAGLS